MHTNIEWYHCTTAYKHQDQTLRSSSSDSDDSLDHTGEG